MPKCVVGAGNLHECNATLEAVHQRPTYGAP